jgi:predicted nucleic acid-binding protein
MKPMKDKIFLDTNILVYAINSETELKKMAIAKEILLKNAFISPQVIFEWINVSRKKFKTPQYKFLDILASLLEICEVLDENKFVIEIALSLLEKYNLQPFDAKIIATALYHNCTILYSEDMQNGLIIENSLKIINPFLNKQPNE